MTRRNLVKSCLGAAAAPLMAAAGNVSAPLASKRPPRADRRFVSEAVDRTIAQVRNRIADPELAWLFENCFPNTLDTTVHSHGGHPPDTFIITGDIDAMWLRDSSAQVWPYLPLAREDAHLRSMLAGVIRRQSHCILLDPYANAFLPSTLSPPLPWSVHDKTEHKAGVGERKWEVDSLCYPIRLAHGYWKNTGDTSPFDGTWVQAARTIVQTFTTQQRKNGPGPYRFQRQSWSPTETLGSDGLGNPAKPVGMIFSMFRPSDDACLFPLFVPANFFAVTSLRQLAELAAHAASDQAVAQSASQLADEVLAALHQHATLAGQPEGQVWSYEVDGYGGQHFMDDANVPSLLALPYLGCCSVDDAVYQCTRGQILSAANPYYFSGSAASGIGSPHTGLNQIWPIAITMQALTSTNDKEIMQCLKWLKATHAGTGFMHESFDRDNPTKFTRPWFAWANSLFGELILQLAQNKPSLLSHRLDA